MLMTNLEIKPKTHEFLFQLSRYLECPGDKEKAKRIFFAVLHAFRDNLSFDQSLQVLTHLPVNLKSIYISDWKLSESRQKPNDQVNFVKSVIQKAGKMSHYDFSDETKTHNYIKKVFAFLEVNIPANKMSVIRSCYPEHLRGILSCKHF